MSLRSILFGLLISTCPVTVNALCIGEGIEPSLSADALAAVDQAVADIPYSNGITWKASRGEDEVILWGSVHIWDPRLSFINGMVRHDLKTVDHLLVEMTLQDQQVMQTELTADPTKLLLPDGQSLIEMVDEPTWELIKEAAIARGLPTVMAARLQPWYLLVMIGTPPCAMQDITNGLQGLDGMVMSDAQELDIPTTSLEDWRTTLAILSGPSIEDQIDLLQLSLMGSSYENAMFMSTLDSYFNGETARVWELSRAALQLTPTGSSAEAQETFDQLTQELLVERNIAWIPVIEDAAANGKTLALFGAAHLPGEYGVLNLLAQNGWTVTPHPWAEDWPVAPAQ